MIDERLLSLYIPVSQTIVHYWAQELGLSGAAILMFINERTLRWGKLKENIPQRHFIKGIVDREGGVISYGVPVKPSCLWEQVRKIHHRNLIDYESSKNNRIGNLYSLRLEDVLEPAMSGKLKSPAKIRTTTTKRNLKLSRQRASKSPPEGESSSVTYPENGEAPMRLTDMKTPEPIRLSETEYTEEENTQKTISGLREQVARVDGDSIQQAYERTVESGMVRKKTRAYRAGNTLKIEDIKAAWTHAVETETDRHDTSPTEKHVMIFRRNFKSARIKTGLYDWFVLVVTQWNEIRKGPLAWNTKMPNLPTFSFVAYYVLHLVNALADIEKGIDDQSYRSRREKRNRGEDSNKNQWRRLFGRRAAEEFDD